MFGFCSSVWKHEKCLHLCASVSHHISGASVESNDQNIFNQFRQHSLNNMYQNTATWLFICMIFNLYINSGSYSSMMSSVAVEGLLSVHSDEIHQQKSPVSQLWTLGFLKPVL